MLLHPGNALEFSIGCDSVDTYTKAVIAHELGHAYAFAIGADTHNPPSGTKDRLISKILDNNFNLSSSRYGRECENASISNRIRERVKTAVMAYRHEVSARSEALAILFAEEWGFPQQKTTIEQRLVDRFRRERDKMLQHVK